MFLLCQYSIRESTVFPAGKLSCRICGHMGTNTRVCGRAGFFAAATLLATLLTGCQTPGKGAFSSESGLAKVIDPAQLQSELHLLMDSHLADAVGTATEISTDVQDRRIREKCLRWKMRSHDVYVSIISEEDPRKAFIYAWVSAVHLRQYLTTGSGKDSFGACQDMAVSLAKKVESDLLELGRKHFSAQAIRAAQPEIENVASRYSSLASLDAKLPILSTQDAEADVLAILKLPLLPVTTLEGAATSTPRAIERFTDATRDFAAIVQHLPETTRWQTELVLLEMETSGPMAALSKEVDRFEKMLNSTTAAVKSLPQDVRQEFDKALASLEKMQPQFKANLADAKTVAEQMRQAVDKAADAVKEGRSTAEAASKTADQFTAAAKALQAAAGEVRQLLADYDKLRQPRPDEKPSAGVADYHAAADSFAAAAREIRTLLDELQHPKGKQVAVGQIADEFRGLADYVLWRAIALAGVIFVLAVAYRILFRRRQAGQA